MTRNMYTVAGDGPCNEELALRIQAGDKNAAERLVPQNEGYLTDLARAYFCAEAQDTSEAELTKAVCEKLKVSSKAAETLLKEYRTLCCARQLGDDVFSVSCGGDPAVAYDRMMRRTLLMRRMEEVLTPRELNLVRSYLSIGQPDEVGMTFQELAIYLNYNGPSGAEKAYKAALRKLKKDLYRRCLRSVALRTESHPRRQSGSGGGAGDGALHNAAENMVGRKGTDGAVYLRGRFADPCSRDIR